MKQINYQDSFPMKVYTKGNGNEIAGISTCINQSATVPWEIV